MQELYLNKEPDLSLVPDLFADQKEGAEYEELDVYVVLHDTSPAGPERLRKLMQPLLDLAPDAHAFYDVKRAADAEVRMRAAGQAGGQRGQRGSRGAPQGPACTGAAAGCLSHRPPFPPLALGAG